MRSEHELSDAEIDQAVSRIRAALAEQSKLIARNTKRSGFLLAVNIAAAVLFLKGMPLHAFFRPLGQILLVTCVLTFAAAGSDVVMLIFDWLDRGERDRLLNELAE